MTLSITLKIVTPGITFIPAVVTSIETLTVVVPEKGPMLLLSDTMIPMVSGSQVQTDFAWLCTAEVG
jgi:hypothetical protein